MDLDSRELLVGLAASTRSFRFGEATVPCYFFIPTIVVKDENKKPIYNVHQVDMIVAGTLGKKMIDEIMMNARRDSNLFLMNHAMMLE